MNILLVSVSDSTRNFLIIGNINYVENKRAWSSVIFNLHLCTILVIYKAEFFDSSFLRDDGWQIGPRNFSIIDIRISIYHALSLPFWYWQLKCLFLCLSIVLLKSRVTRYIRRCGMSANDTTLNPCLNL